MQPEIEADIRELTADVGRPGERAARFRQDARPHDAVEVEDDAFLAVEPQYDRQGVEMHARHQAFAQIWIAVDQLRQGGNIRKLVVDGGLFTLRPLQHPARRAEVAVADLGVVEQALRPRGIQRIGDVDDVDVGIILDLLRQGDIGQAETVAVTIHAAFGHAQRRQRRFGQVVDQDGRRAEGSEPLDQIIGFGDVWGVARDLGIGRGADQLMPRAQRADQDGVVLVFAGKAQVVGEGGGDVQVDAAAAGFPG